LESAQIGVTRNIGGSPAPQPSEILLTKTIDSSSAYLLAEALWGSGTPVRIDFIKTSSKKAEVYLTVKMENTKISHYSVSDRGGSSDSLPMESLSLTFRKVTWGATPSVSPHKTAPQLQTAR
jgi:type VI protein secretion system component Hcp